MNPAIASLCDFIADPHTPSMKQISGNGLRFLVYNTRQILGLYDPVDNSRAESSPWAYSTAGGKIYPLLEPVDCLRLVTPC